MFITGLFATVDLIYYEVNRDYLAWLDVTGLVLLSLYGFFNSIVSVCLCRLMGLIL